MNKEIKTMKARAHFEDFVKHELDKTINELSSVEKGMQFAKWYINEINNNISTDYYDEDDFVDSYVDSSGDLGIDFISKNNNIVTIIQFKYKGKRSPIPESDIDTFFDLPRKLINHEKYNKNANLAEKLGEIDIKKDTFRFIFVGLGKFSNGADVKKSEQPKNFKKFKAEKINFEIYDESEINRLYKQVTSKKQSSSGQIKLFPYSSKKGSKISDKSVLNLQIGDYPTYLVILEAYQLVEAYNLSKESLFELNIRQDLGNTITNKALQNTIENDPQEFYYLNNGISCIAEEIQIKDDAIICENLQIINGAQTVKQIVKASLKNQKCRESIKKIKVLTRITEISQGYGTVGRFQQKVVTSNNTQNSIKASDFVSNDQIQQDIAEKFRKECRYKGKQVIYQHKRFSKKHPAAFVFKLEDFIKSLYAFKIDPYAFSNKTNLLYSKTDGAYLDLFGEDGDEISSMRIDQFKYIASIWWLSKAFTDQLKFDKNNTYKGESASALERRWPIIHAAKCYLELSYQNNKKLMGNDFFQLYRGDWEFGEKTNGKWVKHIYEMCVNSTILTYRHQIDSGMKHRTFFTSPETPEKIFHNMKDFFAVPNNRLQRKDFT